MLEEKLISHIKIYIPAFNEFPLDKAKKWAKNYYRSIWHIRGQGRKSVSSQKDYREKVAKPLIDECQKMMDAISKDNPDWRSTHGHSPEDIMAMMKYKMLSRRSAHKYLQGLDKAFGTKDGVRAKDIKDRLNLYASDYAQKMTFGTWRYLGPINPVRSEHNRDNRTITKSNPLALDASNGVNGQGKGAFVIAGYWLTGNPQTPEFLREKDEIVNGPPILITAPSRKGLFQRQLCAELARSIVLIDNSNYALHRIKEQNDRINQWVNDFVSDEFVSFSTDGPSHIDFVTIPKTAELFHSERLQKVRDNIHAYFLRKKPEKEQPVRDNQPNASPPAPMMAGDLIGDNKLPICMDMYLDVQVSTKKLND